MQNHCSNEPYVYAGFWARFAAFTIDHAIILVPILLARLIVSGVLSGFAGTFLGGNVLFQFTLADIFVYLLEVTYFIVCTYNTGATLGKRLMNLQVISTNEDGKLTLTDIMFRETAGRFLCGFMMSVGYIMVGLDNQKRGFHDMLADTRVVYADRVQKQPVTPAVQNQVQEMSTENTGEVADSADQEFGGFTYVPTQVEPAPAFGETSPQVTEGNYFYISGNELPKEEESSEEVVSEEETVD